jgi:hypothetical protein
MVNNVGSCIPTIEAQAKGQLLQMGRLAREREEDGSPKVNGFIAVIESRIFLQECIRRSMQSAFSLPILTCSTLSELELGLKAASAAIVIVSWMEASNEANTNVLNALSELVPLHRGLDGFKLNGGLGGPRARPESQCCARRPGSA